MKHVTYYSKTEEKKLWDELTVSTQEIIDNSNSGLYYELRIFYPYILYVDKVNSEVSFANREYAPLGHMLKNNDATFKFVKADISHLPEGLKFIGDNIIEGRKVQSYSFYEDHNTPATVVSEHHVDSAKEYFNDYFKLVNAIDSLCEDSFIIGRMNLAYRELYLLRNKCALLAEENKRLKTSAKSM